MKVRDAIAVIAQHDLDEECVLNAYFPDDIIRYFREHGFLLSKKRAVEIAYDIGYQSGESFTQTVSKWCKILSQERSTCATA
jgi:AraC-like DNA-binding protein